MEEKSVRGLRIGPKTPSSKETLRFLIFLSPNSGITEMVKKLYI